jgi:hypothetical protein
VDLVPADDESRRDLIKAEPGPYPESLGVAILNGNYALDLVTHTDKSTASGAADGKFYRSLPYNSMLICPRLMERSNVALSKAATAWCSAPQGLARRIRLGYGLALA